MEKYLGRDLEAEICSFAGRREMIFIRGARQTGKTTLMKHIMAGIDGEKRFVNLDLPDERRALEQNPKDFVKRYETGGKLSLFLDEVQRVDGAGEKLKIIYDEFEDLKVFASGSSSLELKSKVLPPLVGRALMFELYTFGFGEFLEAKDKGFAKLFREKNASVKRFIEGAGEPENPSFEKEFLDYWRQYVIFGGYPEIIKSNSDRERETLLKNIFDLYLEKDVVNFFQIRETSGFENFLKNLSFNISSLLNLSSAASDARIKSKRADEFIEILKNTYVVSPLGPLHGNLTTELKKAHKIYFLDMGMRNAVLNNFTAFENRPDRGELAENFVFRELKTNFGHKMNFWRTAGKAEVDFVLTKGDDVIPIEVKLSGTTLGKSFYSFINAYEPKRAIVATLDKFEKRLVNGTTIYFVPVFYF
ncbi:MAG: hypothetical protein MSIBF_04610 [Candidatus Altiarchaeales archaeon IMC4]|nr:MAG: hypothetical protein MSIBF_04610 [Candidatus Altiarchaeales archaeon IMC4]